MRYKNLSIQEKHLGEYALVPIRMNDQCLIRKWRNEQMYHLRQQEPLTEENQRIYFDTVVASLFTSEHPSQFLFSYVQAGDCIGYGGLVHINYEKQSAELSFIMATELEETQFAMHWSNFLKLIQPIAFQGLGLQRIFTYAYDLRPHLYPILENHGFYRERTLPNVLIEDEKSISAIVHSKWNANLRPATPMDEDVTYQWAKDPLVRKYSFQQEEITKEGHARWFQSKLENPNCFYFLLQSEKTGPMGSFRLDVLSADKPCTAYISYLLDPKTHGKGLGIAILVMGEFEARQQGISVLIGEVIAENSASCAIFAKLGYERELLHDRIRYKKSL